MAASEVVERLKKALGWPDPLGSGPAGRFAPRTEAIRTGMIRELGQFNLNLTVVNDARELLGAGPRAFTNVVAIGRLQENWPRRLSRV